MAHYVEFPTSTSEATILVEVDKNEIELPNGVEKAGVRSGMKYLRESAATAHVSFDAALKRVVQENVRALTAAVQELEEKPDEIELTFGLKATGEVGNLAIGKMGGEANFMLKLSWKAPRKPLARESAHCSQPNDA